MSWFLWGAEFLWSGLVESWSLESGVANLSDGVSALTQQMPDLVVNVQNLGTGGDAVASILGGYLPFLSGYSDRELFIFGFLTLIWMLCVIWTLRDAMARSESTFYQFFSVLLVVLLTPIVGLPLYLAFRPLVYKWERGLWREALEQNILSCPHCEGLNATNHKACVWCGEPLQVECKECHCKYSSQFSYCPECWAPNIE